MVMGNAIGQRYAPGTKVPQARIALSYRLNVHCNVALPITNVPYMPLFCSLCDPMRLPASRLASAQRRAQRKQ